MMNLILELKELDYIAFASVVVIIVLIVIYVCVTHYETTSRQKWIVISLIIFVFIIDLIILFSANPEPVSKYNVILFIINIFSCIFVGKMIFVRTYVSKNE